METAEDTIHAGVECRSSVSRKPEYRSLAQHMPLVERSRLRNKARFCESHPTGGVGIQSIVCGPMGHFRIIRAGRLIVHLDAGAVWVDDQPVHLTGKEYGILELLSCHKGTTVTKEMFLNHLYGGMNEPELKIIDVFICKLRKKLAHATGGNHHIETVWGRGYVLRDPKAMEAIC
jgi:DNA-binding winged helix-turn-helix (wHTH) protein